MRRARSTTIDNETCAAALPAPLKLPLSLCVPIAEPLLPPLAEEGESNGVGDAVKEPAVLVELVGELLKVAVGVMPPVPTAAGLPLPVLLLVADGDEVALGVPEREAPVETVWLPVPE